MAASRRTLEAVGLMLLSMAGFAGMSTVIRMLSPEMHPTLMVFLRNCISLLIIIAWCTALARQIPRFPTARLSGHFWRATLGTVAMELWFYSLTVMPLTLATALSFTTPIFSTIFAILFLREKAGLYRWGAIITGFAGVLVILRPDAGIVHPAAAFVLLSSSMMAAAGVLIKTLTRTESPETIVFYMALFMIPWSLAPALPHWQAVTAHQWWLLFLIALFSTLSHLLLARAFVRADMVVLMPLDFTRLIFVSLLAYVFFGETMNAHTAAGAGIIVMSAVYIARREAKNSRKTAGLEP